MYGVVTRSAEEAGVATCNLSAPSTQEAEAGGLKIQGPVSGKGQEERREERR